MWYYVENCEIFKGRSCLEVMGAGLQRLFQCLGLGQSSLPPALCHAHGTVTDYSSKVEDGPATSLPRWETRIYAPDTYFSQVLYQNGNNTHHKHTHTRQDLVKPPSMLE